MKRRQILFTAPGTAELLETSLPEPESDDILVEMEYTVISGGTERACLRGLPNTIRKFPVALGYCGIGHVLETGSMVSTFKKDDRVLVYHGHHTTHNMVREHQLTLVENDAIPSIEAAFVIIASMSLGGIRKVKMEIGESAMVVGQGILGIFATQLARINGACPVIAADLNRERRELALEVGADHAFDPADGNFEENVRAVTRGRGVNAMVEVTGVSAALQQSLECAAPQARVALLGCTRISDCPIDYYQQVHRPGISLIGAHNFVRPQHESYPHHWTHHDDCRALLDLIAAHRLKVKPVISEILSPEKAPEIYSRLAEDTNVPVGQVFSWREQAVLQSGTPPGPHRRQAWDDDIHPVNRHS